MKPSAAILLFVALLLVGGCGETPPGAPSPVDANTAADPNDSQLSDANEPARIQSLVLARAWSDFLADAVIAHKKRTGEFPPGAKDPNYPLEVARRMHRRHNWVFLVSPRREQAYARGEFNQADVADDLDQRIAEVRKLNIRLPWLGESIIYLRRVDNLRGASLVLGRRILDAQLMDVIAELRRRHRGNTPDPNGPR